MNLRVPHALRFLAKGGLLRSRCTNSFLFSATSALFLSARRLPRPGRGAKSPPSFLLSVRCDLLSLCRSSPTFPRTALQFVLNYFFSPISSGGTLASNQPHRSRLFPLPPLPPSALLYRPSSRLVPHRHRPRRGQAPHRRSRLCPSRRVIQASLYRSRSAICAGRESKLQQDQRQIQPRCSN